MHEPPRVARTLFVAAVLVALMALTACGSEPDPTATPQPPPPTVAPPQAPPTPMPTVVPATPATAASTPTTPPEPTATPQPTATPTPSGPMLPATVTDVHGHEVVVEDISRIVVMNGDITEVVFAIGLGENVVAVDTSATYPEAALRLPKIGYQRSLSAEGVLSMDPTVVIGNEDAGPPEVLEQIRATGVPVVVLVSANTIDGAARKIRGVAQALGVSERGETIATKLEAQIEEVTALAEHVEERPTAVFLYMRGMDTLFLIGRDHISHELFEASGAISGAAVAGVDAPFIPLTAESLAAVDPDCIVVLSAGLESVGGREGLLRLPGVAETNAADTGCILDFDGQYFGGGGPRVGDVLMDLLRAFQPGLAP